MSEKDLHYRVKINGNTNICGAKMSDGEAGTDPINVLTSEYGNLILMKVAAILSENPSLLGDGQIGNIKVLNP